MIDDLLLSNLLVWAMQVAGVVALGALVHALIPIDVASVRYGYWRCLLMLCLVLPWVQGRVEPSMTVARPPMAATVPAAAATAVLAAAPAGATAPPVARPVEVPRLSIVAGVLLTGAALRLLWVGAGLWRLRGLRREGVTASSDALSELQQLVGTRAEVRYVSGLGQPVTFGTCRPVVLLPESLVAHAAGIQRVVLCHELWHVKRRDWAWLLAEEIVRAVCWFHPAMWWLISRVQLAREEVVDQLTVLATAERRDYVKALMAFADEGSSVPAHAFSRRRHLFRRMVLVSKESVMSSTKLLTACAVMALVTINGTAYVVSALPMSQRPQAPTAPRPGQIVPEVARDPRGPLERTAKPVTPENPIPRRTFSVQPERPAGLEDTSVTVTLRLTLDASGRVAEVRDLQRLAINRTVLSGQVTLSKPPGADLMPALIQSATRAVRQWQYEPPFDAPLSFDVQIEFRSQTAARASASGIAPVRVGGNIQAPVKTRHVTPEYPPLAQSARVQGVVILEAVIDPDGRVEDARVLRSIPLLDQAAVDAVRQWEFTPTMLNGQRVPVIMTVTVQFTLPAAGAAEPRALASPEAASDRTDAAVALARLQEVTERLRQERERTAELVAALGVAPVRVGGVIRPPVKTRHVAPDYPAVASAARVQGVVILEVVIGPDGRVVDSTVLRSIPLLDQAARDAVLQWEFTPTLVNGQPVPVIMTVTVQFTLPGERASGAASFGQRPLAFAETVRVTPGAPAALPGLAPVSVGGAIMAPARTRTVSPVYPADASAARVQGIVILEAVIGPDGRVQAAKVLRSIPLLDQAALDAVRQWEFTPTLLNGVPVPFIMTVTVQFSLDQVARATVRQAFWTFQSEMKREP